MEEPRNKRDARKWVRNHWAEMIDGACMGFCATLGNKHIDNIWADECEKIARRLR